MTFARTLTVLAAAAVLAGCASQGRKDNSDAIPAQALTHSFGHPVPAGAPLPSQTIVSSKHVGTHTQIASHPWRVAHFRPNFNMPELVNEDVVNATLDAQGVASLNRQLENGKTVLMTMPRLKLLPCDEGCVGNPDYEKIAKRFADKYAAFAEAQTVAYRGEVRVKVRWMVRKTFVQKINPLSTQQEVFAIQFPIEGNMLTISQYNWGKDSKLEPLVDRVAQYFNVGVMFPMSLGLRNYATIKLSPNYDPNVLEKVNTWGAPLTLGLRNLLGQEDYRSRFEAPTEADAALFPAMDGIAAGEGKSLTETAYFESL